MSRYFTTVIHRLSKSRPAVIWQRTLVCGVLVLLTAGCGAPPPAPQSVKETPRPVSVWMLRQSAPGSSEIVTGSVDAWKTEQIGFEVSGRVRWVIEPEQDIEGRRLDRTGTTLLSEGSVLAQLDDERYGFAVESAEAAVEQARRQKEAVEIEIARTLPARIQAAQADEKLAQLELNRLKRLLQTNSTAQSQVDQADASLATATAQVATLQANLEAKRSELRSAESQIRQAEQSLAEARRDLADCSLYSSFRGQSAQVHVVPGSVVTNGAPVVTVQMMDPMKVEVEVSSDVSRSLQHGDTLELQATDVHGDDVALPGFVYMTDPVADPQTRTFTVTFLTRNQKLRMPVPDELAGQPIARTSDVMPLNLDFIDSGRSLLVEERSIHRDDAGAFVWRVLNRRFREVSLGASPILQVEKVRVTPGDLSIPYLGNWTFVPITFAEGVEFDVNKDMVAGELFVDDGDAESWEGDRILFDQDRWLLRPGDLVRVNLGSEQSAPGLYVPMKSILNEAGQSWVFVVDNTSTPAVARKVEVSLPDISGTSLQRIEPVRDELADGAQIVTEGVHYLYDGEPVSIAAQEETL